MTMISRSAEWIALGLFAAYGLVAFGIRTWIQVRHTGDSGFRGLSGRTLSAEWWAGVLFMVAIVIGVAAPVAGLLGLPAISALDHSWVRTAGIGLTVAGIAATFVTQLAMGDNWRIGVDESDHTDLVTTGPFALARNPIFTAMIATGLGLALVVPNVIALAGWALLVVAIELQVRVVEEPYLRRLHGAAFEAYEARIGRFVPGIGRS